MAARRFQISTRAHPGGHPYLLAFALVVLMALSSVASALPVAGAGDSALDPTAPALALDTQEPAAALEALAEEHGGSLSAADRAALTTLEHDDAPVAAALARVVDDFRTLAAASASGSLHRMLAAQGSFLDAVHDLSTTVRADPPANPPVVDVPGLLHVDLGTTDDLYATDYIFLVDAGGNDTYHDNAGGNDVGGTCASPALVPAAALVDLAGDDAYGDPAAPRSCGVNGGAMGGVGLLVDLQGNDTYVADHCAVDGGAPPFSCWEPTDPSGPMAGLGLLLDARGSDTYSQQAIRCDDCSSLHKGNAGAQVDGDPGPQVPQIPFSGPATPSTYVPTRPCVPHPPISIQGDVGTTTGFVPAPGLPPRPGSGVVSGNGTAGDPYVIEGWCIPGAFTSQVRINYQWYGVDEGTTGILIANTRAHVVVRDVQVWNHGTGVVIRNATNVVFENSVVAGNHHDGILLTDSDGNILANDLVDGNGGVGVDLSGTWSDFYPNFDGSDGNVLTNLTVTHSGQDGLRLDGFSDQNRISGGNLSANGWNGAAFLISSWNTLDNATIQRNGGAGVVARGVLFTRPADANRVLWSDIGGNAVGIRVGFLGDGTRVHGNDLHGNGLGVDAAGGERTDARGNWWGCSAGPTDAACDGVAGPVSYEPWLTAPNPEAGP